VLAHVAHHEPAPVGSVLAELLHEFHVAPVNSVQPQGVVVAVAAHLLLATVPGRELVPFLAGHLTGLAADAHGRVGIETHWLRHVEISSDRLAL
jgi:hypothetical protein